MRIVSCRPLLALVLAAVLATATLRAERRTIDADRSTLTVSVYKSGMFSGFGDNHVIRAPIASGSISADPPLAVDMIVRSASLTVLDPKLAADKRLEVQSRMLGAEVLDSHTYPEIGFTSTSIESVSPDQWTVTGRLSLHGETRQTTFAVTRHDGRYQGTVAVKLRDFGIKPISVAGGTVKVKDELKVEFDIVAQNESPRP
jgi:polyisoprenoid-binding protein YceI